jgi:hypothetical protein
MRLCDQLTIQKNMLRTMTITGECAQLTCQDKVLSNLLEDVDWSENPVKLMCCEKCGDFGCADHASVDISRMGEDILLGPPKSGQTLVLSYYEERLYRLNFWGSIFFPHSVWQAVVGVDLTHFPRTTREDIMLSWMLEYYGLDDIKNGHDFLNEIRQNLRTGAGSDNPAILGRLERLVAWFEAAPAEPVSEKFVPSTTIAAQIVTLSFGARSREWPAFALVGGSVLPAFSGGWVYFDESLSHSG